MLSERKRAGELERLFGDEARASPQWWPDAPRVAHGPPERSSLFSAITSLSATAALGIEAKLWPEGSYENELTGGAEELLAGVDRDRATAKIEGVDRLVPTIAEGLSALTAELGTPIRRAWANLYVSAPGVGVAEHADGHEVIALQLSGAKEWSLSYAAERTVFSLRTGSVLFVPRGVGHATTASEPSVSLSLAFACYTLADVAARSIARLLYSRPGWDRVVGSLDPASSADDGAELDGILRAVGTELASGGVLAVNAAEGRP